MKKSRGPSTAPGWNHNIHYHRIVLDAVPAAATSALDVGTGDGLLALDLQRNIPHVTALDSDSRVLVTARNRSEEITWVEGDITTFDPGRTFDVVASIATVHHLPDLASALTRMAALTTPGGTLVIIGLGRTTQIAEGALHLIGAIQHRWFSWRRGFWEHTAPTVSTIAHSYTDVRRVAMTTLPGCQFRRLPLWRYSLIWQKPR